MIRIILYAIPAIVILFLIVVALQPSTFSVTRTAKISGPPSVAFAQVNDLHAWEAWSPWAKMDPSAKSTYEGPASGVGAVMSWAGNNKVGAGKMTITESKPNEMIEFRLEFLRPMQATHKAEFTFKPEGNATLATWTMSGKNGFMGKVFGLIMSCDKMIGGQFEQGLAQMNAVVTGAAKEHATA
jgi:hypothetical protein